MDNSITMPAFSKDTSTLLVLFHPVALLSAIFAYNQNWALLILIPIKTRPQSSLPDYFSKRQSNFSSNNLQWAMKCPGKRQEGEKKRISEHVPLPFPWEDHGPAEDLSSCGVSPFHITLSSTANNCSLLPLWAYRANGVSLLLAPGTPHYSCPCGFSITLWVIKLSSKYWNLRIPSVSCWVSLIQISSQQISYFRKAARIQKQGEIFMWALLPQQLSSYFAKYLLKYIVSM